MTTKRRWTEEELKLLNDHLKDPVSASILKERYFPDRSIQSVANKIHETRKKNGTKIKSVETKNKGLWTDEDDEIIRKYAKKLTCKEIRDKYFQHKSTSAVSGRMKNLGLCSDNKHDRVRYVVDKIPCGNLLSDDDIKSMVDSILKRTNNEKVSKRRTKIPWTESELFCLIKYYGTMSCEDLHNQYLLSRSIPAIHAKAEKIGVSGNLEHWTDDDDDKLISLYSSGKPIDDIAKEMSRTVGSIISRITRINNESGSVTNYYKWDDDQDAILLKYKNSMSIDEIQKTFFPQRTTRSVGARLYRLTHEI